MATITWLRAHGQLADALTKPRRDTPLQQTVRTGAYAVPLAPADFLTKRSAAAPEQDGFMNRGWADNNDDSEQDSDDVDGVQGAGDKGNGLVTEEYEHGGM